MSEQDEPTVEVVCNGCGRTFQMYRWAVEEGLNLCHVCLYGEDEGLDIFDMHHDLLDLP